MDLQEFVSKLPKVINGKKVFKWKAITSTNSNLNERCKKYDHFCHTGGDRLSILNETHEALTISDGFGKSPEEFLLHRPIFRQRVG